jgi:hypothetical protein
MELHPFGTKRILEVREYNDGQGLGTPLLVTPKYFINSDEGEEGI